MKLFTNLLVAGAMLAVAPLSAHARPAPYTLTTQPNGNFTYDFDVSIADYFPGETRSYYTFQVLPLPAIPGHLTIDLSEKNAGSGLTFGSVFALISGGASGANKYWYADLASAPLASATLDRYYDGMRPPLAGPDFFEISVSGPAASGFKGTISFAAVPEPATWGMMVLGFAAAGMALRRRRPAPDRLAART